MKRGSTTEMAANKKIDTLIGQESSLTGRLESSGTIRVDGKFEGDIITKSDLVVGESGQVHGKIKARNITVAGLIKGELEASGKLELVPTAVVEGEAKMSLLVVEEGAVFQGNCQQIPKDQRDRGKTLRIDTPKAPEPTVSEAGK